MYKSPRKTKRKHIKIQEKEQRKKSPRKTKRKHIKIQEKEQRKKSPRTFFFMIFPSWTHVYEKVAKKCIKLKGFFYI